MPVIVDITLADVQQEGTESVVERWLRQPGEHVRQHEPLLEINTDKAIVEVPAPATGVLREIFKPANAPIRPGDILGRIEAGATKQTVGEAEKTPAQAQKPADGAANQGDGLSPAVRRLVREHGVDVSKIKGTGRGGRITYEDVQGHLKQPAESAGQYRLTGKKIPHSPMRRRIAQHMVESMLKTAPHVTAVFEVDLSTVVVHRRKNQPEYERNGVKLTYSAYFVAAAVQAVQAVPEVNSRWHEDALEVYSDCNIGIASAVEGGLLVPVICQAQLLDLAGIADRLQDLTARARRGKLQPNELRNGTFTITNHGVSGSLIATPIINQPQSAILGIGKIEKRVVVVDDGGKETLQIKPMAYATLTIDHRALDGFQANTFLTKFAQVLADWPG
ncbi:MAG TPA: 2-oxo acid dehydrogenase subunit E2 [Gemmataceae bacterium]|nr:2-oxo acid dehydrogenase subunit E2 [Gemmataceae bacterium]